MFSALFTAEESSAASRALAAGDVRVVALKQIGNKSAKKRVPPPLSVSL